jgi:RHS repeat-associated protein
MRVGLQATLSHFGDARNLIVFLKSAAVWTVAGNTNVVYVLKETGPDDYTGWFYMMDPIAGRVYVFEKRRVVDTTNTEGLLRLIMDRNGNCLTYFYSGDSALPTRIEDGLGRSLDFVYSGNTTTVTDQAGRPVTIRYNSDYPESDAVITSAMGYATKLILDLNDNILRTEMPLGNIPYSQTYIADEVDMEEVYRTATQTDAYGNKITLDYGASVAVTAPDGGTTVFEHWGENGSPKSVTDPMGRQATFQNTLRDQIGDINDRLGGSTSVYYHLETGKIEGVTNAGGNTIARFFTAQGQTFSNPLATDETVTFTFYNPTRIKYPDGGREELTYDARGNLVKRKDQAGARWLYTYNERGQVLTVTNPAGGITTRTYNADATLASVKDSDTGLTKYGYDGYKRVNKITHPDGTSAQIAYDLDDRITSVTDENGRTYRYLYDANGNLDKVTDPEGKETLYAQDLMDRLTQTTNRLGKVTTRGYDSMGRLASETLPSGLKIEYGYDLRGWMTQVSLADRKWLTGYNDEGVVTSKTTPAGHTTTLDRDSLGRTTAITDPLGHASTFTYDVMNRLTAATDPLDRKTSYTYDKQGNLSSVSMPKIGEASYRRNSLGLLSQVIDPMGFRWKFSYNPTGRMRDSTDPSNRKTSYAYDQDGRIEKVTYANGTTLAMSYDKAGNVVERKYSAGPTINYAYDALNRLIATNGVSLERDAEGHVTTTKMHEIDFTALYDADGRVEQVGYADDAFHVAYTYDPVSGLLTSVSDSLTGTWIAFTYDADGNPIRIVRSNGVEALFTYDAAGRLEWIRDGSMMDLRYTFDAAGQITDLNMKAPLDPERAYTDSKQALSYNGSCQIASRGYHYDQLGRITASPRHTFIWNGASKVVKCDGATLDYDGAGRLLTRQQDEKTTRFHYNLALGLDPVMAESDKETGQFLRYYVWTPGGALLFMIDAANGNKVSFFHFDHLGSTLALTDAQGQVTDAYSYGPYGKLLLHTGSSTQPFTFAGRLGVRQEGSTGTIYHMRARYYDAATGRFVSKEPLWPNVTDPLQLNPYQYAVGEPTRHLDITGLFPHLGYVWAYHFWKTGQHLSEGLSPELKAEIASLARENAERFRTMFPNERAWLEEHIEYLKEIEFQSVQDRREERFQEEVRNIIVAHGFVGENRTVEGAFQTIDAASRTKAGPPCNSQQRSQRSSTRGFAQDQPLDEIDPIADWIKAYDESSDGISYEAVGAGIAALSAENEKDPIWGPLLKHLQTVMLVKWTTERRMWTREAGWVELGSIGIMNKSAWGTYR